MELLAPVGNKSMLVAAVKAGCNAIYFGVQGFNMRASANNFSLKETKEVVNYCHKYNVKAYCTVNVVVYESELKKLEKVLKSLKKAKIDAIICWDFAVVKRAKELGLEIHLSTQASVSNSQAALFWKEQGISRIVLARECSIEDAKEIKKKSGLEIEMFVHGARCISYSGRCFMSQELFNKSANRGECLQPCRREYKVIDEEGKEMIMSNNFIMSAKDLCALPILDKLKFVDSFKIEGRNRGAEYVFKVVSVYRKAIDAINKKESNEKLVKELLPQLEEVYNKGFSTGFFVDYPHHQRASLYGSKATTEKVQLGLVKNYYNKIRVAEFKVETHGFKQGDKLAFIGPTTGYEEIIVDEIHTDDGVVKEAQKGEIISVKVNSKVRVNDKVYLIKKRF
ncbi:protease [Candidatus Woesearchaeota archaeon CG_4_10_14_0_2_um_filter_33_13]|nr:MAG: protease [Candidatus Woesearchaeota archaeon CG_4_10_14_0_2_um_filter_33_13]